jgi:hypothetical protein
MALKDDIKELKELIAVETDAEEKAMLQEMLDEMEAELKAEGGSEEKKEEKKSEKKTSTKKKTTDTDKKKRFVFEKKVEGGKEVAVIEAMTQEEATDSSEEGFEFVKVITRGRAPKTGFIADEKPKGKKGRPAKAKSEKKEDKKDMTPLKDETAEEMAKRLNVSKEDCEELIQRYEKEAMARKKRVESRKKAGKTTELSVDESLENEAEIIENKVEKKAPTKKQTQKATKSITKILKELVTEMQGNVDEKVSTIDKMIAELEKVKAELVASKKARGGMFGKGGKTKEDETPMIPVVRYFFEDEPQEYGKGGNS